MFSRPGSASPSSPSADRTSARPPRDFSQLRRLVQFARPYLPLLALGIVCTLVSSGLNLIFPGLFGKLIDASFLKVGSTDTGPLDRIVIELLGIFALSAVFGAAQSYLLSRMGASVVADLRRAVFSHLLTLSPAFFRVAQDRRSDQPPDRRRGHRADGGEYRAGAAVQPDGHAGGRRGAAVSDERPAERGDAGGHSGHHLHGHHHRAAHSQNLAAGAGRHRGGQCQRRGSHRGCAGGAELHRRGSGARALRQRHRGVVPGGPQPRPASGPHGGRHELPDLRGAGAGAVVRRAAGHERGHHARQAGELPVLRASGGHHGGESDGHLQPVSGGAGRVGPHLRAAGREERPAGSGDSEEAGRRAGARFLPEMCRFATGTGATRPRWKG